MLWPDDVTDEQLALAAAKCDEDEQTREGNSNESFLFWISSYYFNKLANMAASGNQCFCPLGYGRLSI